MSAVADGLSASAKRVNDSAAKSSLVVVGAATGMGRWLAENLLARFDWLSASLIDVEGRRPELVEIAGKFRTPAHITTAATEHDQRAAHLAPAIDDGTSALIVVTVPSAEIAQALRPLKDEIADGSTVAVVSEALVEAIATVSGQLPDVDVVGMHPLFERTALSIEGQLVYIVPPEINGSSHVELTDLIRAAGGVVKIGEAGRHDQTMKYVQAAAQQTLLNFADVLSRADLDLEEDLWASRTPLFESLFGLVARVLDPRQRSAIESIQATAGARHVAEELLRSAQATTTTLTRAGAIAQRLDDIGEHISGALFSTARRVAEVSVSAAQSTRAELSRRTSEQEIVGLRSERRPGVLHVGRIVEVGPTDVLIDDLLIPGGQRGGVLATGPGVANGRRVGANGEPRRVSLNIGQVILVSGPELDAELDARLAFIRRDVRFLVPESVSGLGVLSAIRGVSGTRGHELLSEVVRTGQRAVVIRVEIRADNDIDGKVEAVRSLVQQVYTWPIGISRPANPTVTAVAYLGPAGTFSEAAARQCATAAGIPAAKLIAADGFADVTARLGQAAIAVVPISSSSSGLVTRAFDALWPLAGKVIVGGLVDVSVRLDAYISAARSLEELRGARLYSHPQALAQCAHFIQRWKLRPVECQSTAEALRIAAVSGEPAVALAAADADIVNLDLRVGEREVDDLAGSITRFLILGAHSSFAQFSDEYTPTTRSIWLGRDPRQSRAQPSSVHHPMAFYQEKLADDHGNFVLITSQSAPAATTPGLKLLGSSPWSPRTPVVRVSA